MTAGARRARISIGLALTAGCAAAVLTAGTAGHTERTATTTAMRQNAAARPVDSATGTVTTNAPATSPANVLTAPTLIAHTAAGDVGYRVVGQGPPLLLIMGRGGSMDNWAPSFVDALAARHQVVVFDNAGIGQTAPVGSPLTIPAMADQTSALITALRLRRPAVLGWSLGGMVAQALAAAHPAQVGRLILAATQPGTGRALPIPPAAQAALNSGNPETVLSVLFPRDQAAAAQAYLQGILEYPGFYEAPAAVSRSQDAAIAQWMAGQVPVGHQLGRLRVPTLVADGTRDRLDPAFNDMLLARGIRGARLLLFPDAGHAFLFQDAARFTAAVEWFLRWSTGPVG
jgi:pimeloyl-ACP methyl ester carboxylesterase